MKNSYLLSIIVPAYNCEAYLRECLQSVLDQLEDHIELIVSDDGSTDGTAGILAEYEDRQENIKVLYNAHKGASGARNAGLAHARGEFVSFLDCDDCLFPGFLKQALPLTESGMDLYIFGIQRVLLSGERETWGVNDNIYPDISDFADAYIRVRKLMIYSNCNKFYRREIIEKNGIRFDERLAFGEDRLFNYDFLKHCRNVTTSSLTMINYIQRSLHSKSTEYLPDYPELIMQLHKAKMDCFLELSKGTTQEEKQAFIAYDIARESELMRERNGRPSSASCAHTSPDPPA